MNIMKVILEIRSCIECMLANNIKIYTVVFYSLKKNYKVKVYILRGLHPLRLGQICTTYS